MVDYSFVDVHFGEVSLKGRNRNDFVKLLSANIFHALSGQKYNKIERTHDRILIHLSDQSNLPEILDRLSYVFGVAWYAPVIITENSLAEIFKCANLLVDKGAKIRIEPNRSFKGTQFNSEAITHMFIKKYKTLKFSLDKDSKVRLFINVTSRGTFLFTDKRKGLGGLPVGSSGKGVVLLSGGIDSPVAAFYAMKRGLKVSYLHMHMYQSAIDASNSKIGELVSMLEKYSPEKATVYYAPAHIFQSYVIKARGGYDLILLKRFLYKLAEKTAKKEGAFAIVTGESLGQVASQTLTNLLSEERGCKLLVMRPLIGFDKQEIVDIAKKMNTFNLSIKAYKDVCSINSRNPPTSSEPKIIEAMYKKFSLDKALKMTLEKTVKISSEKK